MSSRKEYRTVYLKDIQPSQSYLSDERLEGLEGDMEPLPVRKIGDRLFFTDGHHRAYRLLQKGREEIKVRKDEDDMDWLEYLVCVDWCENEGLMDVEDLGDRIVDEDVFEKEWLKRCEKMHQRLDEKGPGHFVEIEEVKDSDDKSELCELILRSLPDYFGIEKAIQEYIRDVRDKYFLSAKIGEISVGFCALKDHNEFTSELYLIGVLEELQGRGIGKRLIGRLEKHISSEGKKYLTVKTLGPSRESEYYERTRGFYRSVGFVPLEEFKELWDDDPCLFMVMDLED